MARKVQPKITEAEVQDNSIEHLAFSLEAVAARLRGAIGKADAWRALSWGADELERIQVNAFAVLLRKCASAAHDIEWVDSGDYGQGDERKAIEACLLPGSELDAALAEARSIIVQLQDAIARCAT